MSFRSDAKHSGAKVSMSSDEVGSLIDSQDKAALQPVLGLLNRVSGGREIWALIDQALVSGANFITNVLLARALGLSGFGVYALCWMIVLLMSNLLSAFLVSPMMSIGPKQSAEYRPVYNGAIWMLAVSFASGSALCVFAGVLAFSRLQPQTNIRSVALPLAIATAAYQMQDFTRRYFFSQSKNRMALLCDALSYLTQLPILWYLAYLQSLSVSRTYWIIGLTSLFGMLISSFGIRALRFTPAAIPGVLRRNSKLVRWLVPSAALQWTSLNLVMIFAPVYYGAAAAGALRACQNLVAVAHIWFLGLENVLPPQAAEQLHARGVNSMTNYLRKATWRWGLITVLFMGALSIAPDFWLRLLYGGRYSDFGYVLRLYGVLYVLIFLGGPLRAGLQALEHTAPLLWSYAAMTTFAAVTAAPLAKHFGLAGVMLGLIATQIIFQAILLSALVGRIRRVRSLDPVSFELRN